MRVIHEERLLENAKARGQELVYGLLDLSVEHPVIGDVRGLGLMIATEFTRDDGLPDTATSKAVAKAALDKGLMLLTCGTYDNIIRWIPPLIVTQQQISDALNIFANAIEAVERRAH